MRKEDTTNNILVYVENTDGAPVKAGLEALTPARKLAEKTGGQVIAAVIGKNISEAAQNVAASGADRVLAIDSDEAAVYDLDGYADILKQIIEEEKPDTVLLGGTGDGKDLAAKLMAQLDTAAVTDVSGIRTDGDKEVFVTSEYSGAVCCDVVVDEVRPRIAVTRSGAFKKPEGTGTGSVEARDVKIIKGKK